MSPAPLRGLWSYDGQPVSVAWRPPPVPTKYPAYGRENRGGPILKRSRPGELKSPTRATCTAATFPRHVPHSAANAAPTAPAETTRQRCRRNSVLRVVPAAIAQLTDHERDVDRLAGRIQAQHRFVNDAIGFAREIDWFQRRGHVTDAARIQQHARQHSGSASTSCGRSWSNVVPRRWPRPFL